MNKNKTYNSKVSASIHEIAVGMHEVGLIDKKKMSQFDEGCLTPVQPFNGEQIKALREREEVTQTVFAYYLGVTKDFISKLERGEKKAGGSLSRLLAIVERNGLNSLL
ncbi:MAG: helix-turn-helix domain-containing protein [Alphaproteobacteria bacterium]